MEEEHPSTTDDRKGYQIIQIQIRSIRYTVASTINKDDNGGIVFKKKLIIYSTIPYQTFSLFFKKCGFKQ